MSSNDAERQQLEKSLTRARRMKASLDERLLASVNDPVSAHKYELDLEGVEGQIARLEEQLAKLDKAGTGPGKAATGQGEGASSPMTGSNAGNLGGVNISDGRINSVVYNDYRGATLPGAVWQPTLAENTLAQQLPQGGLSFAERSGLVERLLRGASMGEASSRNVVVQNLPGSISSGIARDSRASVDVTNILTACLNHPHGWQSLLEVLSFFEQGSLPFQELKRYAEGIEGLKRDEG